MFCTWSDTDIATCVSMNFMMLALHEHKSKLVQDGNMLRCQGIILLADALQQPYLPESASDQTTKGKDKDHMQAHMAPAKWPYLTQAACIQN